jgi:hypothetical protein
MPPDDIDELDELDELDEDDDHRAEWERVLYMRGCAHLFGHSQIGSAVRCLVCGYRPEEP